MQNTDKQPERKQQNVTPHRTRKMNRVSSRRICTGPFLCILFLGMLLIQCKSGKKSGKGDSITSVDTTGFQTQAATTAKAKKISGATAPVTGTDTAETVSFLLPSPDEILTEIFGDTFAIDNRLPNPKENAAKYLTRKKVALNLGVYVADFAYLNLSDNKSDALAYFKTIRSMAQKVNIYGLFNESLLDRLENNLTHKDSLRAISKEVYYNMLSILESSNRNNIYAMIASGAMVESLYLSTMLIKSSNEYQDVAGKIFEQKYILTNFYDFASQYSKDPDVGSILNQINQLKLILQNTHSKTTAKKVKKISQGHIEIEGGEDITVTPQNLKIFKEKVNQIRNDIISVGN